jgi:hypothetical protein
MAYKTAQMRNTFLLPKLVTNLPEKGIAVNWPEGSANKILPKAASLKCIADLISGMRLAHEAKQSPWQKKKAETAMRICFFE